MSDPRDSTASKPARKRKVRATAARSDKAGSAAKAAGRTTARAAKSKSVAQSSASTSDPAAKATTGTSAAAKPAPRAARAPDAAKTRTLQAENRELKARLDLLFDTLAQGVSVYDADARLVSCNPQFLETYGLPASCGRRGTPFRRILEARVRANSFSGVDGKAYIETELAVIAEDRQTDGLHRLNSGQVISVTHRRAGDGGWLSTHQDVTDLFRMQDELTHLAYHDALTGLPNRAMFYQRLGASFERKDAGDFSVLCLDLDGFKRINDTLGHAAGDALLCAFSRRLTDLCGRKDLAARMGGDEFAILCAGRDRASALRLAASIEEQMARPFDIDGHAVSVKVGIGLAEAPVDGEDTDQLLHSADLALYAAKRDRQGGVRPFERAMETAIVDRQRLERDLRLALEHGQFELHYQPVLDLSEQQLAGFEALVRWRHPQRGLISPAEFIPVAEETGLILRLGEWVLREALAEAAQWPPHLRIAVNVSTIQLVRGDLVALLINALATTGIARSRVELEITESVFLENSDASLETLRQLRELGVRIALDDFGTGYSALGYLLAFPFDKIKIDGGFVRALEQSDGATTIVGAVADIGARMGITTTAEGVETAEQLRAVYGAGYSEVQGYLVSRPLERGATRRLIHGAFDTMPSEPLEEAPQISDLPTEDLLVEDDILFEDVLFDPLPPKASAEPVPPPRRPLAEPSFAEGPTEALLVEDDLLFDDILFDPPPRATSSGK